MSDALRRRIAIALGDPAGIGPEVALKAALDPRVTAVCQPLLVGNPAALALHAASCGLSTAKVEILPIAGAVPEIGQVRAAHGAEAIAAARAAIEAALAGEVDAVVAAPHTERAVKEAGIAFDGYPGLVAGCAGVSRDDVFLMLCFDSMRIAHLTLHMALKRAASLVTRERVLVALEKMAEALHRLGIAKPRIAVAGLNPHAGEGGMFGDEEELAIGPAIAAAQTRGVAADGPFGADTMLRRAGYDAFLVMYHDQGHIAAKLLAPERAAAVTIGTNVLFASVGHGSALDIAGQNRASAEAMVEAVLLLAGVPRQGGA
ncbi:MAG TPA: 4-hydroxythreonine-4-phosphate dehydrogenase PdxA [Stellaceae bacterium]|nr:4-hydroxythreonine-4-phosphate dehydrogenase PdxA [Stellaceae bacterium]